MSDLPVRAGLRVLVTNDDGVEAPALGLLARHLANAGHDVRVAAPSVEYTGCGASIGLLSRRELIPTRSVFLPGAPDIAALAVDGPPSLAVLAACLGLVGARPDVVVSGTNSGYNTGPAVLHSGTVGAALTAAANGIPAVALSSRRDARDGFTTAAQFCAQHLHALIASSSPRTALNINVPDLPLAELAGVRLTTLAEVSMVSVTVRATRDGFLLERVRSDPSGDERTDTGAIAAGLVSITTLHAGVRDLDLASLAVHDLENLLAPRHGEQVSHA